MWTVPGGDKVNTPVPCWRSQKGAQGNRKASAAGTGTAGDGFVSAVMDAVSECLDEEVEGDFVNVSAADGTTVRIYVDK